MPYYANYNVYEYVTSMRGLMFDISIDAWFDIIILKFVDETYIFIAIKVLDASDERQNSGYGFFTPLGIGTSNV
jgi:hypothetical protein